MTNPFDFPEVIQAAVLTEDDKAIQAARSLAEKAKVGAVARDQQRIYPRELLDLPVQP